MQSTIIETMQQSYRMDGWMVMEAG